jgi:hypothetical protein
MADPNSSVAPGVKIGQYKPAAASNQLWVVTPVPGTDHWTIQSYVSNLYVTAAGTTVGANITQQPPSASKTAVGADQQWDLTLASKATVEPGTGRGTSRVTNGSYRIINASSALSLSVSGPRCWAPSGAVVVNQFSNTVDQRWTISNNPDGTYTLTSDCGLRLTDPNASTAVGAPLVHSSTTSALAQHWQLSPVAGTNNWTIRSFASNLFATAVGGAVGSMVVQADFNAAGATANGPLQEWTLVPTTGRASASGLAASAHGLLSGNGSGGLGTWSPGGLAFTGAGNTPLLVGLSALLLITGALLSIGARRRRAVSAARPSGRSDEDADWFRR